MVKQCESSFAISANTAGAFCCNVQKAVRSDEHERWSLWGLIFWNTIKLRKQPVAGLYFFSSKNSSWQKALAAWLSCSVPTERRDHAAGSGSEERAPKCILGLQHSMSEGLVLSWLYDLNPSVKSGGDRCSFTEEQPGFWKFNVEKLWDFFSQRKNLIYQNKTTQFCSRRCLMTRNRIKILSLISAVQISDKWTSRDKQVDS